MNITQERIDELNSILKVEVSSEDYQANVEKVLKDYQKKMNVPGFRPGKVPASVVRKMYGKAVLVEEINKLVVDSMYNYLEQNKIDILGNPMPNVEKSTEVDWDTQTSFEFFYDLGLNPVFDMEPLSSLETTLYNITANDEVVEKYMNDIRRRYGKYSNPEEVAAEDLIYADFIELDENGEPKEGGINHKGSVAIDLIKNKTAKKKFIGLKKEETIDVDMKKTFEDENEIMHMLGVTAEQVAGLTTNFRLKILAISRVELAEVNAELFEKVYKADNITSEEQLRERIKKDVEVSFATESDRLFVNEVVDQLIKKTSITLPDAFLKRWLLETNHEKFTAEQIEAEYHIYAESLKWQLIENKLIKDNDIQVTREDLKEYVKDYFRKMAMSPVEEAAAFTDEQLNDFADRMLQNQEEAKKIYDKLYDDRMKDLFKGAVKTKQEEISYDEFVKLVSKKQEHKH